MQKTKFPRIVLVLSTLLLAILAACSSPDAVGGYTAIGIDVTQEISGLDAVISYDAEALEFAGIASAQASVLVAANDSAGQVSVAAISAQPVSGEVAFVSFRVKQAGAEPSLASVTTFDASGASVAAEVSTTLSQAASNTAADYDLAEAAELTAQNVSRFDSVDVSFGVTAAGDAARPFGDVNADGTVDSSDALLALQIATGINATPSAGALYHADISSDTVVRSSDALLLLFKAVGGSSSTAQVVASPSTIDIVDASQEALLLVGNAGAQSFGDIEIEAPQGVTVAPALGGGPVPGDHVAFTVTAAAGAQSGTITINTISGGSTTVQVLTPVGGPGDPGASGPIGDIVLRESNPVRDELGVALPSQAEQNITGIDLKNVRIFASQTEEPICVTFTVTSPDGTPVRNSTVELAATELFDSSVVIAPGCRQSLAANADSLEAQNVVSTGRTNANGEVTFTLQGTFNTGAGFATFIEPVKFIATAIETGSEEPTNAQVEFKFVFYNISHLFFSQNRANIRTRAAGDIFTQTRTGTNITAGREERFTLEVNPANPTATEFYVNSYVVRKQPQDEVYFAGDRNRFQTPQPFRFTADNLSFERMIYILEGPSANLVEFAAAQPFANVAAPIGRGAGINNSGCNEISANGRRCDDLDGSGVVIRPRAGVSLEQLSDVNVTAIMRVSATYGSFTYRFDLKSYDFDLIYSGIARLEVEKVCDPITTWTGTNASPGDVTKVQGDAAVARAYSCIITVTNASNRVASDVIITDLLPPELGVIESAARGNATPTPTNPLTAGGFTYTPSGSAELALAFTDTRDVPEGFAGKGTYDDTLHTITWSFTEVPQLQAVQPGDSITVGFNFYPRHKPGYVWNDNDQNRTRDGNLARRQTGYFFPSRAPSFGSQPYSDPYFVDNPVEVTARNTLPARGQARVHVVRPFLALEKVISPSSFFEAGSPSVRGTPRPRVNVNDTFRFELYIQNYDRGVGGSAADAVSYIRGRPADQGYANLRALFPTQYAQEMTAFRLQVRDIFGTGLDFVNAFDIDSGTSIPVSVDVQGGSKTATFNLSANPDMNLGEIRRIGIDFQALEPSATTGRTQHFADAVSFGGWQVRQNNIGRNEQQPIVGAWINCVRIGAWNLNQQVNIGDENNNIGARTLTTDPTPAIVIDVNKLGAPWVYPFYSVPPVQREADHAVTNYFGTGRSFLAEYLLDPRPSFAAEGTFGYNLENTNPETAEANVAVLGPKSNGLTGAATRNVIQDCREVEVGRVVLDGPAFDREKSDNLLDTTTITVNGTEVQSSFATGATNLVQVVNAFFTSATGQLVVPTETGSITIEPTDGSSFGTTPAVATNNYRAITNTGNTIGGLRTSAIAFGDEDFDEFPLGQPFEYRFRLRNSGTGDATNVVITDTLPGIVALSSFDAIFVRNSRGLRNTQFPVGPTLLGTHTAGITSAGAPFTVNITGNVVTVSAPVMQPDDEIILEFIVSPTQVGEENNRVVVTADQIDDPIVTEERTTIVLAGTLNATVNFTPAAGSEIEIPVLAGEEETATITLLNTGDLTLEIANVAVTGDDISVSPTSASIPPSGTLEVVVTCDATGRAAGEVFDGTVSITHNADNVASPVTYDISCVVGAPLF